MITQLSLFDQQVNDTPIPIQVSEKWNFKLNHAIHGNGFYLYCARDWYIGLGGSPGSWRLHKSDWVTDGNAVMLEVKRRYRKPEMLEFVSEQVLYSIVTRMESREDRPQLDEIKGYLEFAGVKLAELIREPEKAARQFQSYADQKYAKQLREKGYSEDVIAGLIADRHENIVVRVSFADAFYIVTDRQGNFATVTNVEYQGLFGKTARQIKALVGGASARAGISPIAQTFCKLAEQACMEHYRLHGKLSPEQAYALMRDIAEDLGGSVFKTSKRLGIDVVTGKPLLE